MIDHTGVNVEDFEASREFYAAALAPLGYELLLEFHGAVAGFGEARNPDFWIGQGEANTPRVHVAFRANTRREVEAFYEAALGAGGRDNGAPGLRPQYHPDYYAAFVLDLDGHNVEAVCHMPA
ncbi:MAG: VOC family protein [Actinobacteria bacterium]|nr:VOC family protein [Actinomycetota bacterium]